LIFAQKKARSVSFVVVERGSVSPEKRNVPPLIFKKMEAARRFFKATEPRSTK